MAESSTARHPTGGRRRKVKGQRPSRAASTARSSMPAEGDSSDELEDEKEAKRPRSTSTTPRSGKGLEPYEYDKLMGSSLSRILF